ncbi:MAG: metallohydrolase [Alphaproteobacteria bacterium]|nr:metallohydrolase [Alphaproteobacteria bacterium]MBU4137133.1 metallohydrolase [Alphaproteobacteria bacterium]
MAAKIDFFRVGNGDMTLVRFESGRTLLIDCNIRKAADDSGDETPDVASQLKDLLKADTSGRKYVDAMLLSHPDKDHCSGLETHFHLGKTADYPSNSGKILIREMWSSPIVFRRASKDHTLCEDANAWCAEARRRVGRYRDNGYCDAGERILILGEDIGDKTDGLEAILVKVGQSWSRIDGTADNTFEALLLAPLKEDDEEVEELLSKNDSSTVVRLKIGAGYTQDACRFLTGGDAGVAVWERIWDRNKNDAAESLGYDLLQAPHHCSWHSLSWHSWSQMGEAAEVSEDARDALGQPRSGATVVASSKPVEDDQSDPPCIRAKREYESILKPAGGKFVCVGDGGPEPLAYDVEPGGIKGRAKAVAASVAAPAYIGQKPVSHG